MVGKNFIALFSISASTASALKKKPGYFENLGLDKTS